MTVEIIHGDCRQAIAADFDCMIADPPYSEAVHKNATSQRRGKGVQHRDLGFAHLSDELRRTIALHAACVKRWSLIYSDVEGLEAWRRTCETAGAKYIRPVPWVRWSMPQLSGDRPPQGFELVTCFWGSQSGRKSWNGPGNLTHLKHTCLRGEGKHKCEKPLDQALDLVQWFSNPGDRILDPCAGSGTVGLACKILGRDYVGYEIDGAWAEKAAERIAKACTGGHNGGLSDRDQERFERWLESQQTEEVAAAKRKKNTDRVRHNLRKHNGLANESGSGAGGEASGSGTGGEAPQPGIEGSVEGQAADAACPA